MKPPPDLPRDRPLPSTKNRRRWCRGKVGVEHAPVCRDYRATKGYPDSFQGLFVGWRLLVCTACGKELAIHAPSGWHARRQAPPAWVDR
jgi:hypothetical protein